MKKLCIHVSSNVQEPHNNLDTNHSEGEKQCCEKRRAWTIMTAPTAQQMAEALLTLQQKMEAMSAQIAEERERGSGGECVWSSGCTKASREDRAWRTPEALADQLVPEPQMRKSSS